MTEYRNRSHPTSRKMTRVQFEMIAEVLKNEKPRAGYKSQTYPTWQEMVRAFANMCASANPRFDRSKFERACGLEE